MPHVVLLGDSIFDNAAYVRGGPDVVAQLADALPDGWRATLAAVDGAVIDHVAGQLRRLPPDATHLVVSAGGNDALAHTGLLDRPARGSAEVLGWLADAVEGFEARYRRMLSAVLARGLPTTVCTIYEGNLGPPVQRLARVALAVFDDAILRVAAAHGVPVIELRHVCTEPADYANPIEPSVRGGAKIARAIVNAVTGASPSPERAPTPRPESPMVPDPDERTPYMPPSPPPSHASPPRSDPDVDEAVEETFPASDPPSWTPAHSGSPDPSPASPAEPPRDR